MSTEKEEIKLNALNGNQFSEKSIDSDQKAQGSPGALSSYNSVYRIRKSQHGIPTLLFWKKTVCRKKKRNIEKYKVRFLRLKFAVIYKYGIVGESFQPSLEKNQ